jgi:hypothetical protein
LVTGLVTALTALAAASVPSQASAMSIVSDPGAGVVGFDLPTGYVPGANYLNTGAFTIQRSGSYAGNQSVNLSYYVYQAKNGAWQLASSGSYSWFLAPGKYASTTGASIPLHAGTYTTLFVVTWRRETTSGSVIAKTQVNFNAQSDYRCWTANWMLCKPTLQWNYGAIDLWGPS